MNPESMFTSEFRPIRLKTQDFVEHSKMVDSVSNFVDQGVEIKNALKNLSSVSKKAFKVACDCDHFCKTLQAYKDLMRISEEFNKEKHIFGETQLIEMRAGDRNKQQGKIRDEALRELDEYLEFEEEPRSESQVIRETPIHQKQIKETPRTQKAVQTTSQLLSGIHCADYDETMIEKGVQIRHNNISETYSKGNNRESHHNIRYIKPSDTSEEAGCSDNEEGREGFEEFHSPSAFQHEGLSSPSNKQIQSRSANTYSNITIQRNKAEFQTPNINRKTDDGSNAFDIGANGRYFAANHLSDGVMLVNSSGTFQLDEDLKREVVEHLESHPEIIFLDNNLKNKIQELKRDIHELEEFLMPDQLEVLSEDQLDLRDSHYLVVVHLILTKLAEIEDIEVELNRTKSCLLLGYDVPDIDMNVVIRNIRKVFDELNEGNADLSNNREKLIDFLSSDLTRADSIERYYK